MGLALYPTYLTKGDLSPDAFGSDVDHICQTIHDACKGFGTDEKKLLQAMGGMTLEQRCQVPIRYKVSVDIRSVLCDIGSIVSLLTLVNTWFGRNFLARSSKPSSSPNVETKTLERPSNFCQ